MSEECEKSIDFIIIGAMKCATTSFHAWLRAHPDIYMVDTAETGYFLDPGDDRNIKGMTNNEIRGYRDNKSLFRRISEGYEGQRLFGERSTDYSKFPYRNVNFKRICEMNNRMRFLYVVRNPLDRMVSNYFHFMRHRRAETDQDFNRELLSQDIYLSLSCYYFQIVHYLKVFPEEHIKVVIFENLMENRDVVLREVCDFLEVDNSFSFPDIGQRNANPLRQMMVAPKFNKRVYRHAMSKIGPDMEKLSHFLGMDLFEAWDVSKEKWTV